MPKTIVQLELNKPTSAGPAGVAPAAESQRAGVLALFGERLLRVFGAAVPEAAKPTPVRFGVRIEAWRTRIRSERDPDALEAIAREVIAACEAHADRFTTDIGQRETEVADLMGVLRDVVETLRGDSRRFEVQLHRSTDTMRKMVDIEDIREIKRVLTKEVDTILKASSERQSAESKRCERLTQQVDLLRSNLREARTRALTDALTGVPNRGAFDRDAREWFARAKRTGKGFSLAMVDLDDLKKINDTHGHQVGDRVLIACAQIVQESLATGESVSRYGGEEFAVLLHHATIAGARAAMQSAIARIPAGYHYEVDGQSRTVAFSFSVGVTEYASGDTPEAMIRRADDALYDAKRRGKKRVESRQRGLLGNLVGWAGSSAKPAA